jgi:hypothetical protein
METDATPAAAETVHVARVKTAISTGRNVNTGDVAKTATATAVTAAVAVSMATGNFYLVAIKY